MHGRNIEPDVRPAQHALAAVPAIIDDGGAAAANHDDQLVLVAMGMNAPVSTVRDLVDDKHAADRERNLITFLSDYDAAVNLSFRREWYKKVLMLVHFRKCACIFRIDVARIIRL